MFLRFHDDRAALRRALSAALAARRTDTLRDLLALQGEARVARALAGCPPRLAEDALSLLPADRRRAIGRRLGTGWSPLPLLRRLLRPGRRGAAR